MFFVDLKKPCGTVLREEPWFFMTKSGVAEKYVRLLQEMYESSMSGKVHSESDRGGTASTIGL